MMTRKSFAKEEHLLKLKQGMHNISEFIIGHPYRNTPFPLEAWNSSRRGSIPTFRVGFEPTQHQTLQSKLLRERVLITVGTDQLNEYAPEYNVNHIY